jgi:hypothetical protein
MNSILLDKLVNTQTTSEDIISFIEKNKISIDIYLPSIYEGISDHITHIPLIYYCCSLKQYDKLFLYLLKRKVNLNLPMMCTGDKYNIELLFFCQNKYIPILSRLNIKISEQSLEQGIVDLLINGNIKKLLILNKYDVIKIDTIINTIKSVDNLMVDVFDKMYFKLIDEQDGGSSSITENYICVFKFIINCGITFDELINVEYLLQMCLDSYCIDVIQFFFDEIDQEYWNPENIKFIHYSNMPDENKIFLSLLYNDDNYYKIKNYIDSKIKKRLKIKIIL